MPKIDTAAQTDQKTALVTTAPSAQTLTPAKQMEMLFRKLGGNRAFSECRGNFDSFDPKVILGYNYDTKSGFTPTKALQHFEEWVAPRKIMLNLLAAILRDRHTYAYGELLRALTTKGHILEGEIIPLQETTKVTVIIPDAKRAFLLARWLYVASIDDVVPYLKNDQHSLVKPVVELTDAVMGAFPEMRENTIAQGRETHPISPTALLRQGMERLHRVIKTNRKEAGSGDMRSFRFLRVTKGDTANLWYDGNCIGFMLIGFDGEEIRKKSNRKDQDSMGIWKFDVPTIALPWLRSFFNVKIGFHRESEHPGWTKRWPCFASNKPSQRHGAVLLINDDHTEDGAFGNSYKPVGWSKLNDQSNVSTDRFLLSALEEN